MTIVPPSFPAADAARFVEAGAGSIATLWTALAEAAGVVATLAQVEPAASMQASDFPARIQELGGWRLRRAERELADVTIIMEHGLAALLAVNARGADPRPAARALLAEFEKARAALLAMLEPAVV